MKLRAFHFNKKEKAIKEIALKRCKSLYILSFSFLKATKKTAANIHKTKITTDLKDKKLSIIAPIIKKAINKSKKLVIDEKKFRIRAYIFIIYLF